MTYQPIASTTGEEHHGGWTPIRDEGVVGAHVLSHGGEFAPRVVDVVVPGRMPWFEVGRCYRGMAAAGVGQFRRGWSFGHSRRLSRLGNDMVYVDGLGGTHVFTRAADSQFVTPAAAFLAAAAAVVCADQVSKALAGRLLADRGLRLVACRSGLRRALNHRGGVVALPVRWAILIWTAAFMGAGLVVVHWSSLGLGGAVGLGLVLGGAAGNLVDRLLRGAVVDFIALRAWPTFNLADAAMVAGTLVLAGSLA